MAKKYDREMVPKDDDILVKTIVNDARKNRRPTAR